MSRSDGDDGFAPFSGTAYRLGDTDGTETQSLLTILELVPALSAGPDSIEAFLELSEWWKLLSASNWAQARRWAACQEARRRWRARVRALQHEVSARGAQGRAGGAETFDEDE